MIKAQRPVKVRLKTDGGVTDYVLMIVCNPALLLNRKGLYKIQLKNFILLQPLESFTATNCCFAY